MTGINLSLPGITVKVKRSDDADPDIPLPAYETKGAAGMDLCANFGTDLRRRPVSLMPMGRALIPTGLSLEIPDGFEGQVRPRSGLALRHGITVANAPGTIDSDYRGQVSVILINLGTKTYEISHGDRIAQLVLAPVIRIHWALTDTLDDTPRGSGGFGSTGKNRKAP
ncbi:dUTP pyrophosphatase [Rubricella aquisinus]|uniref:Deoxyuridine 5'-triphosphate nucleotidohydrolase n=1 Tax=Rubricella aquisinus TaxID=2028108 RepID=A0A840WQG2_9RHOB|nr:dUTP diphosphatase [Rubricella aquisinus]MBB5516951.1 dUTP pyrophosphatase [Rubricella aquisinus]